MTLMNLRNKELFLIRFDVGGSRKRVEKTPQSFTNKLNISLISCSSSLIAEWILMSWNLARTFLTVATTRRHCNHCGFFYLCLFLFTSRLAQLIQQLPLIDVSFARFQSHIQWPHQRAVIDTNQYIRQTNIPT